MDTTTAGSPIIPMRILSIESGRHLATLDVWDAPQTDLAATPIHFAAGNGFTAGAYRQMLEELTRQSTVYAVNHRAVWTSTQDEPIPRGFSWSDAANDLIATLDSLSHIRGTDAQHRRYIGVGHSLGGVMTLLAARKRPDLFEHIVLIDPVMFPTSWVLQTKLMTTSMRQRMLPMVKRTLRRRVVWDNPAAFVAYHMGKHAFHGISQSVMEDYAEHGLYQTDDDKAKNVWRLRFPTAWEAHIFGTLPYAWGALKSCRVPCTVIRPLESHLLPSVVWQKWARLRPDFPIVEMPAVGHLAPLQQPEQTAALIQSMINNRKSDL